MSGSCTQSVVRPDERLRRIMDIVKGPLNSLKGPVAKAFGLAMASLVPVEVRG